MAKRIRISTDDATYYTLPGNSAELRNEAGELNDTIFGQDFSSGETGLISWTLNTNALYKGFAGYIVSLKKQGATTAMVDEAMSLVSGKTYIITAPTKRIIDPDVAVVVEDNAVAVDEDDIESINYMTGEVTFVSSYVPTTPVTMTASYFPTSEIAGAKSFTLTQTAEAIDETDIPTAKANGGYSVFSGGLKTVSLELSGIYKTSNAFATALAARETVIIEINPDNSGLSVARGIFKFANQGQSGDVGGLEEETISLRLSVPDNDKMATPFTWIHSGSTTLNQGVVALLDAWLNGDTVYAQYLPDGTTGFKGEVVPTDISLTGGLEAMNEFTVNLQGSGAPTAVP